MKRKVLAIAAAALALGGAVFAIHVTYARHAQTNGSCEWVCPLTGKVICPKKCPQDCGAKTEQPVDCSKPQE
jgi:hypothetical protein